MACDTPIYVTVPANNQRVPVPCGRCPPCKMRRVNEWVFRLLEEEKRSTSAYFVTLTYDTRTVPISPNGFMTLRKKDLQDYFKRLRKLCPGAAIKYYAVGEYGTKNERPHYHAIFFNVTDTDSFVDAWRLYAVDIGAVHIGKVTGASIAYTLKYIDKAGRIPKHSRDDREKEFPLMSKGMGDNYLTDQVINYHKADLRRLYLTKPGGHKVALPRYYRKKMYDESEMQQQIIIVQSAMDRQESLDRQEHRLAYPNGEISFEAWQESRKYGRNKSFYSRQNRKL